MTALARPVICLVTSRHAVDPGARTLRDEIGSLERWLDESFGAVDLIQIRERDLPARELGALVSRLVGRSRGTSTRILVNDRADVAISAGADGIHLRADSPPTARVRDLLRAGSPGASASREWVVSRSIHTANEAETESRLTAESRASVLVFGSIFTPLSKPAAGTVAGVEGLAEVVRVSAIPVLAIGGVTPSHAAMCRDAGAAGVAAISVFLPPGRSADALGPRAATAAFRSEWTRRT